MMTKKQIVILICVLVGVMLLSPFCIGFVGGVLSYKTEQEQNEKRAAAQLAQAKKVEEKLERMKREFEERKRNGNQ